MGRTAFAITTLSPYLEGTNVTKTAGDSGNNHQVDASFAPKLIVVAINVNAATVDYTVEIPASSATFNETVSKAHTIPAAVGGVPGVRAFAVDGPGAIQQAGNVIHIDSADANFADVHFLALTWTDTPK